MTQYVIFFLLPVPLYSYNKKYFIPLSFIRLMLFLNGRNQLHPTPAVIQLPSSPHSWSSFSLGVACIYKASRWWGYVVFFPFYCFVFCTRKHTTLLRRLYTVKNVNQCPAGNPVMSQIELSENTSVLGDFTLPGRQFFCLFQDQERNFSRNLKFQK
jgi:hypothetical protein